MAARAAQGGLAPLPRGLGQQLLPFVLAVVPVVFFKHTMPTTGERHLVRCIHHYQRGNNHTSSATVVTAAAVSNIDTIKFAGRIGLRKNESKLGRLRGGKAMEMPQDLMDGITAVEDDNDSSGKKSKQDRLKSWRKVVRMMEEENEEHRMLCRAGLSLNLKCKECGQVSATRKELKLCVGKPEEEEKADERLKILLPQMSDYLGLSRNSSISAVVERLGKAFTDNNDDPAARFGDGFAPQYKDTKSHWTEKFSQDGGADATKARKKTDPSLPEGWKCYYDPASKRDYYHNKTPTPAPSPPLPKGWIRVQDISGKYFFHNPESGESQWEVPREVPIEERVREFRRLAIASFASYLPKNNTSSSSASSSSSSSSTNKKMRKREGKDGGNNGFPSSVVVSDSATEGDANDTLHLNNTEIEYILDSDPEHPNYGNEFGEVQDDDARKKKNQEEDALEAYMKKHTHKVKLIIGKTIVDHANVTNITGLIKARTRMDNFIDRVKLKGKMMADPSYKSNHTNTLYIFGSPKRAFRAKEVIEGYLENYKNRMVDRSGGYRKKQIQKWQVRELFKLRHGPDYEILELPYGSNRKEIEKAYKKMRVKWHPDKYKTNPEKYRLAHDKFKEIQKAYERLTDDEELHERYLLTHSRGECSRYVDNFNVSLPKSSFAALN
eukprot:jgi/Bigna1/66563/fgenesh1_pg.1_\